MDTRQQKKEGFFGSSVTKFNDILGMIAAILILFVVALVVFEVIVREVFSFSTLAAEEVSGLVLVVVSYLGLGYCFLKGGHIIADFVHRLFRPGVKKAIDIFNGFLAIAFAAAVFYFGLDLFLQNLEFGIRTASRLRTPMAIPSFAVPIGAAGFGLAVLLYTVILIKNPQVNSENYFESNESENPESGSSVKE